MTPLVAAIENARMRQTMGMPVKSVRRPPSAIATDYADIMRLMRRPRTTVEVAERLNITPMTAFTRLSHLERVGKVKRCEVIDGQQIWEPVNV